jgi:hypothetical protein
LTTYHYYELKTLHGNTIYCRFFFFAIRFGLLNSSIALNNLIHEDQKGFIQGRFIGENTRLIYDIIFGTEAQDLPGMIMMIDFEKAFNTLQF